MSISIEETRIDTIDFGEKPEDRFYCLADRRLAPDGLQPEKMRLINPRNLDQELRALGCIAMMTETELAELRRRGVVRPDMEHLHEDLYTVCKKEGLLDPLE
ncbi:MAG: hypothetical protein WD115_01925 [Balneolaceae bacterium]